MRNPFDFNNQIVIMNEIFQSNINLAQTANLYLNKLRPDYISRAVKQLKMDYQWLYLKQDGQKFNSIRSTLHLIAKQKVNNLDELFMDLGEQINTYYGVKYFDLKKKIPYSKQCQYCHQYVSNYQEGLFCHQEKCTQNIQNTKKTALKNAQRKIISKKSSSQNNKLEKIKETDKKGIQQNNRISKKQSLSAKIDRKKHQLQKNKKDNAQTSKNLTNYNRFNQNTGLLEETDWKIPKYGIIAEDKQQLPLLIPISLFSRQITSSSLSTEQDQDYFFYA